MTRYYSITVLVAVEVEEDQEDAVAQQLETRIASVLGEPCRVVKLRGSNNAGLGD